MLSFFRNRFVWIGAVVLALVVGGGLFMNAQGKAKKAKEAEAAAQVKPSPFAAIANGKADVEGGIIQVASRTAGVVKEVDVREGQSVLKGQILARQEADAPRLAVETAMSC